MSSLRLASVPYVNAAPLTWGFRAGPHRGLFSVTHEVPARIADLLRAGRVAAGLLPVIEYQNLDDLEILPFLCIASKRRARSVYLASKVPLESVKSVALDASSRTSAALLRIILAHRRLGDVVFSERAPALPAMLRGHDAALLIGDAALRADTTGLEVYDLAAEWHALTGLPFVFAVWAVRRGALLPGGLRVFLESRSTGIANIPTIAREAAPRLGLTPGSIEGYLRLNLHYHLGSEEVRGLDLFFRQAFELGLVGGHRAIRFHESSESEPDDREPAAREPGPADQAGEEATWKEH